MFEQSSDPFVLDRNVPARHVLQQNTADKFIVYYTENTDLHSRFEDGVGALDSP